MFTCKTVMMDKTLRAIENYTRARAYARAFTHKAQRRLNECFILAETSNEETEKMFFSYMQVLHCENVNSSEMFMTRVVACGTSFPM